MVIELQKMRIWHCKNIERVRYKDSYIPCRLYKLSVTSEKVNIEKKWLVVTNVIL